VYNILYNIALLLSLSIFFATYPFKKLRRLSSQRVLVGLTIGLIGILMMLHPLRLENGVILDSRTILLVVSGMVFGLVPTTIGAVMILLGRLYMGGSGLVTAFASVTMSSIIGIVWNKKRYDKVMEKGTHVGLEYYAIGIVTHIGLFLSFMLTPAEVRWTILSQIALPVFVFFPAGTYLLARLLFNQAHHLASLSDIETSERLFKAMFEEAPIGMSFTDMESQRITNINAAYLEMLGYTKEEMVGHTWEEFTHPGDLVASAQATEQIYNDESVPLNLDKRLIRKDGSVVWLNLSVSIFTTEDMDHLESLGMALDVTERKNYEQRILAASEHDALTGLYNRVHFENFIQDLEGEQEIALSVAFIDVNGLKILNEAFGRDEGNRLLKRIAEILVRHLPEGDYLSRVGGDEYAALLFGKDVGEAEELLSAVAKEISVIDIMGSVAPSISWGLASVDWNEHSLNDAIKEAELDLASRKMVDSPNMRGKAVYAIINTLYEKNRREELHSRRVAEFSEKLALALNMGEKAANELHLVGLLHDIGKIAIDEVILNKGEDLNDEEWRQMKRHCEIGFRLLSSVEEMAEFAPAILHHHERWDGGGYPSRISGEDIPLASRIITIADAFDAMTGPRPYRKVRSAEEAAKEIKDNSGTQFDPTLAKVFVSQVIGLDWQSLG
jgi:PAS domain S-box-containing protein/diguanylate cyclase (GGDEF)-like protein